MRIALTLLALFSSASAQTLIVGNKMEDTVSFIDLESGKEVARRESGRAPHEIAVSPDGTFAVVVSYRAPGFTGNTLHAFDVAKAEHTNEISLGDSRAPHGLKWIPGTDNVIVTAEASQEVVIVRPYGGRVQSRIPTEVEGSHMVTVSSDGLRAYVSNIDAGSFSVLDIVSAAKLFDIKAGQGTEGIALSPDGEKIYVGNNESRNIMIFDTKSFEPLSEIEIDGVPIRIEISPDGALMATSLYDKDAVVFYDTETLEKVATVELGGEADPVTLLFSPDGKRIWAAATGEAQVVEIDTKTFKVLRRFDAGEGSDGLGYTPISVTPSE